MFQTSWELLICTGVLLTGRHGGRPGRWITTWADRAISRWRCELVVHLTALDTSAVGQRRPGPKPLVRRGFG